MKGSLLAIVALGFLSSSGLSDVRGTLMPLLPYDWGKIMNTPTPDNSGNQLFRFKTGNKPCTLNKEAKSFVEKNLREAVPLTTDADTLRFAVDHMKIKDGFILEFGVATGRSINFIAALNPKRNIYGFDSFDGLPEDWQRSDRAFNQGVFAFHESSPSIPVLKNVILYKGWFKDVLLNFTKEILKGSPISLLHIDCDLYTSTKDVFDALEKNIVSGTIIQFDEFYNYDNWMNHEYKAFHEFIKRTGKKFRYVAYNKEHEQVVVEIL